MDISSLSASEIAIQATIAVFMIVNPIDPVKIVIFNDVTSRRGLDRRAAALKIAVIVFAVLGTMALVGRELLQLFGIDLGAFGVVGGLVVALMGFEMLYGGASSRAQGSAEVAAETPEQSEEDGLIMPLAIPLMAGPGAITTVITMSSATDDVAALIATLIGVAVVSVLVWVGFALFGNWFSRLNASTTAMLARIGGLLLATIGMQLALGGIRTFYGF
ncbi:MarC family protein [Nocardioides sp. YIM 152588]|uniref:MarC family protein n=1 Tax=Nocardioides sp. YIM 152588 TaxID=3158259 RepID=UPI0032E50679